MADNEIIEQLKKCDLFSGLSNRALKALSKCAKPTVHPAGHEIVEEGSQPFGFHLITDGTATVTVHGAARRSLGAGDYFGIVSLLDGKPRSATVSTDTAMTTIFISPWEFRPLLQEQPSIAYELLPVLCGLLREAEDRPVGS
jgi:CRP-like cAMP-binding protein